MSLSTSRERPVCCSTCCRSLASLFPPDELDDTQLSAKLWDVIHALAVHRVFLHNTDHLSDRELYAYLWEDELREPMVLMPENSAYSCHIDILGSGSEEHMTLWLKYYANEVERQRWLEEWPQDPLPEPAKPLYDRDRRLPTSEVRDSDEIM